ncbi:hypothetical protein H6F79_11850 [Trichocoleus sp. FACHB-69]|nr:hypothetical protein [Trichocoleus sp. FACHB-69]
MRRLPFYVFVLYKLLLGTKSQVAAQVLSSPAKGEANIVNSGSSAL